MYRFRVTVQVRYGHFKEYYELLMRLNEISRERGWVEFTYWAPTVGIGNELVGEADYPDLAAFQKESDAFQLDSEAMEVLRESGEHIVQGSARTELLETIPEAIA
jgi:hypothetical protein